MNYPDYEILNISISTNPDLLDVVRSGTEFVIFQGKDALLTAGNNQFASASERFVRTLITDIQFRSVNARPGLSFASLYAFKTDRIDTGSDPFSINLDDVLAADLFVRLKTSDNKAFQPFSPDEPLFNFAFTTLSGLISGLNELSTTLMGEYQVEESHTNPFPELVRSNYQSLDPWKKAVVQVLSNVHHSGILLPLGLVNGRLSVSDYTNGLTALKICAPSKYEQILADASDARSFLESLNEMQNNERGLFALIQDGEGDTIEFKSTLRWDIRAGKTNQAIERACLKSVSAFLNCKGGTLLIGVRDDGSIEGIETDKFPNEDKFLLHLWTLIRTCLGRDFSPYIRTIIEKVEDKTVCLVYCQPSARPVFLRQPGFDEEMFIRVGPSSNALNISEALQYIRERFSDRPL